MARILTTRSSPRLANNREILRKIASRCGWIYKIRPQALAEPFYRFVGPRGGRAIVEFEGARIFLDPFTTSGFDIIQSGKYEADLISLIRERLPPGGSFLDIGANEGVISAVAASIAGDGGTVIAVEPQQRLQDVLEINIAINSRGRFVIHQNVVSARDEEELTLNLGPSAHSGGSSLVRAYKWRSQLQQVRGRSLDSIVSESGLEKFDFVKIDVEGYEAEVISSGQKALAARSFRTLVVDFHGSILHGRGIDPADIDALIMAHGYRRDSGDPNGGFCVYSA